MKKAIMLGLASVGILAASSPAVLASEVQTTSDVIFRVNPNPDEVDVVKPGTPDDKITPEGGGHTKGNLRITHVPDIHFGIQDISSSSKEFHPAMQKYTEANTEKYMPHFVQIDDARGSMTATWSLSVTGSVFTPATASNPKLENTYITLDQQTVTNNVYDELSPTETAKRVTGFTDSAKINTDGKTSVEILKVNSGQNTNSTKTSNVFATGYSKTTEYEASQKNDGITLHVPANDIKVDGETYTATLNWVLADSI